MLKLAAASLVALAIPATMASSAQACEIVVASYPAPPLDTTRLSPMWDTVVSAEIVKAELQRTFEPWGLPGGEVWKVELATRPLGADLQQPTVVEWILNPCGQPLPNPVVGESWNLLLRLEGETWTVSDTISSRDVRRFVSWRSRQ